MIRAIKLSKKQLKMEPADLLKSVGLVNLNKNESYPTKLFVSKETNKILEQNTIKAFKKQHGKFLSQKALESAISFHMFQYGPNHKLFDAIKPGYALIETED